MNLNLPNLNYLARAAAISLALALVLSAGCRKEQKPVFQDEAKLAHKTPADFPQITADIFKPMDGGIELTPEEIMGRNTWNLWSAGNDFFWNHVSQDSFGLLDLLKMLDNRTYPRGDRFKTLGLVNEPGFRAHRRVRAPVPPSGDTSPTSPVFPPAAGSRSCRPAE